MGIGGGAVDGNYCCCCSSIDENTLDYYYLSARKALDPCRDTDFSWRFDDVDIVPIAFVYWLLDEEAARRGFFFLSICILF